MSFMQDNKIFVDTNIIIYAFDMTAGKKHEIAKKILVDLWDSGRGIISTQVLQEFYVNAVQKIPRPISKDQAKEIIRDFLRWQVVINTGVSIVGAIDIGFRYGFSFWDALIIEAALSGSADLLLSEDLQDGQNINGLIIQNPFKGGSRID
jgi:predicted nucleic acid-binding protein